MTIQALKSGIKRCWRPLLLVAVGVGLIGLSWPALADVPTTSYTLPSNYNLQPSTVIAHGDGKVTIADRDCPYYLRDTSSTAKSFSTLNVTSTAINEVNAYNKITSTWQTQPCRHSIVAGVDGTSYVIQVGASSSYPYRIVATRDNAVLWTYDLKDFNTSCNRNMQAGGMALGNDGNLYVSTMLFHKNSSCPQQDGLLGISTSDASTRWHVYLPGTGVNQTIDRSHLLVMPYEDGVATRNDSSMYFYEYDGDPVGSSTFSPTLNGGKIEYAKIVPSSGRAYLTTTKYVGGSVGDEKHLYYKDIGNSTITEVTLPTTGKLSEIFATPSGGVVARINNGSSPSARYYDSSGTMVYQEDLTVESGSVYVTNNFSMTVDDDGNVIARRTFDSSTDRNVIIDSYSPTGTKTRLFSTTSLGVSGFEAFASSSEILESVGDGKMYFILCRSTSSYITSCNNNFSPKLIQLTLSSTSDFPRSYVFDSNAGLEYVALGDSYSSGEGNPAGAAPYFIPPSDTNNCDRSYAAYPQLLAANDPTLKLRAFRTCSGAEVADLYMSFSSESPQISSLTDSTEVVTMTVGGNDIGFSDFARDCVIGICDTNSYAYTTAMAAIVNDLPGRLDTLYADISTASPTAKIFVVGYPQVLGESTSCFPFSSDEVTASRYVIDQLNTVFIGRVAAINTANGNNNFVFVDPNESGSPFVGHELCSSTPYFFGVNIAEHRFSFHPNTLGHQAYRTLIADYIEDNL